MLGRDRRVRRRRVAAVGGAAWAAKKHYDAKNAPQDEAPQDEYDDAPADDQQAPPPAPAAPAGGGLSPDVMGQLKQLGELHEQNVLTDDEFAQQKAKLLGTA